METTLFEVKFFDGRKFRVFCYGKSQKERFKKVTQVIKKEIETVTVISNGIHTMTEFQKIIANNL
jgi:hypothetical protein